MLETISAIICVLFIIIGLVEVFRSIVLFVLRPKGEDTAMTIVPICGHNEEAEYLLRLLLRLRLPFLFYIIRKRNVILSCWSVAWAERQMQRM